MYVNGRKDPIFAVKSDDKSVVEKLDEKCSRVGGDWCEDGEEGSRDGKIL